MTCAPKRYKDIRFKEEETNRTQTTLRLITLVRFAFYRYLQADAHRQKIRLVRQLDGGSRDAVFATANREPGSESRAIHPAPRGAAGHVEQHREASAIKTLRASGVIKSVG